MTVIPQIHALTVTLKLSGKEGAGWYLIAHTDKAHEERRISTVDAEEIARSFENCIPAGDETVAINPFQLVKEGSAYAAQAIKEELAEAEAAAVKVAQLRRTLGEIGVSTPS